MTRDLKHDLSPYGFASKGAGPVPVQKPGSVRRTTSIDIRWPEGRGAPMVMAGTSQDSAVSADGGRYPLAADWIEARATQQREILSIRSSRADGKLVALAGCRAGGKLRAILRDAYPDPADQLDGHFLLLDDLAGASLVSSWGWFAWGLDPAMLAAEVNALGVGGNAGNMKGVCFGFAEGSSSLNEQGHPHIEQQNSTPVEPLVNPLDPGGWQVLPDQTEAGTRRARWIDVWREGAHLVSEGGFQDSARRPDGGRTAIHEYLFRIAVEARTEEIVELTATPQVLPHRECPGAVGNIKRLIGKPVSQLRIDVPTLLAREAGCTHLNDVLRALVCVPHLARKLSVQEHWQWRKTV